MSIVIKNKNIKRCEECPWQDTIYGEPFCQLADERISNTFGTFVVKSKNCPIIELVECIDCKRFKPISNGYGKCMRQGVTLTVKADDFCSAGENR